MLNLSSKTLKKLYPLSSKTEAFIKQKREEIRNILTGKDRRLAIVVGPCSIHDVNSALAYATELKKLSYRVKETCLLVMRTYLEKPRTTNGWKGFIYDPDLNNSNNIQEGLSLSRKLLLQLAELEIPTATEFLNPITSFYIDDLISWGFIGARTTSSQIHRELASFLHMPIGFKNNTDGNIKQAINSVISARMPHVFLHTNEEGVIALTKSEGNQDTHIVLRGGEKSGNYDPISISKTIDLLKIMEVNSRILIDCSHGNCQKTPERQHDAFLSVLNQIKEGCLPIMGFMLESYLIGGNQLLSEDPSSLIPGVSITDPCIAWSETEELVLLADELISSKVIKLTHS